MLFRPLIQSLVSSDWRRLSLGTVLLSNKQLCAGGVMKGTSSVGIPIPRPHGQFRVTVAAPSSSGTNTADSSKWE